MTAPIADPGIYDIDEATYHDHPALSSSGARRLLPPSCPALFQHERLHGQPHKREYDFGTVAHTLLLGSGPEPYVVDADSYRTKAAQRERDDAYARGEVPLLPAEFDAAQEMAAAVRSHPIAGDLFASGTPEQSLFWSDPVTGVPCRARLDWLSDGIVDYKTTTSVWPTHLSKVIAEFGYHCQAGWYLDGGIELDLVAPMTPFRFVFQAKVPPYLVAVVELDDEALRIGQERNELSREIFRDCTTAGMWPGYSGDIEVISLPAYAARNHYQGILP